MIPQVSFKFTCKLSIKKWKVAQQKIGKINAKIGILYLEKSKRLYGCWKKVVISKLRLHERIYRKKYIQIHSHHFWHDSWHNLVYHVVIPYLFLSWYKYLIRYINLIYLFSMLYSNAENLDVICSMLHQLLGSLFLTFLELYIFHICTFMDNQRMRNFVLLLSYFHLRLLSPPLLGNQNVVFHSPHKSLC